MLEGVQPTLKLKIKLNTNNPKLIGNWVEYFVHTAIKGEAAREGVGFDGIKNPDYSRFHYLGSYFADEYYEVKTVVNPVKDPAWILRLNNRKYLGALINSFGIDKVFLLLCIYDQGNITVYKVLAHPYLKEKYITPLLHTLDTEAK